MQTIILVGAGAMGRSHAAIYRKLRGTKVTHVVDVDKSAGNELAKVLGAKHSKTIDGLEADAVDICAPSFLHPALFSQACEAADAVLVEKPLAISSAQAEKMVKTAKTNKVMAACAHVERFNPAFERIRELSLEDGIEIFEAERVVTAPPKGAWFLDERKSGGILFDLMVHDIDLARWLGADIDFKRARIGATDHEVNSDGSTVVGRWVATPNVFYSKLHAENDEKTFDYDSTDSVLRADGKADNVCLWPTAYRAEIVDFLGCARTGDTPRTPIKDAAETIGLLERIRSLKR